MTQHPLTTDAYELIHKGILTLSRAEQAGIRVDMDYIDKKKALITRKVERKERLFKESEFFKDWQRSSKGAVNINSNTQLENFLYKVKGLKPTTFTNSSTEDNQRGSTNEKALEALNIPELNDLLEMRKLKKVRDTYLDSFARETVNGYMHPNYNLHIPRTFRSSSSSPNFQNIPIRDEESKQLTRRALFARPGHLLLEIDFKGMEVAMNACINKDPTLVAYLQDPKSNMHGDMAQQIFKLDQWDGSLTGHHTLRQAAKNSFVFPQFYGDYYRNCADGLCEWGKLPKTRWTAGQGIEMPDGIHLSDHLISHKLKSYNAFVDYLQEIEHDFWANRFPVYAKWKEQWWKKYLHNGYIDLLTGFRCWGVMNQKEVCNYPGQGAGFHCLLWSLIRMDELQREQHWDSRIVGQIHDSMLLDVLPSERDMIIETAIRVASKELPDHWKWINVPMTVEIEGTEMDCSWAEKEKICI